MANERRRAWVPDVPVAPGETIREILEARAISQVDFATRLDRSEKFVSQLVNGKAPLTYETAIELERVLGVPATFWNRAEATYRGLLAQQAQLAVSEEQAEWVRSFPVKDMAERGFIAREVTAAEQAEELLSFFGVSSIEAYRNYWSAEKRLAARMSAAYTPEIPAITAWLRAGERQAELIETAPYQETRFHRALEELRPATRLAPSEWQPLVVDRCAAAGVAVVFVPDLPKTRCHAVSWWASKTRAVIQLGLFYKTDDQLWFSFYHEAGHLLLDKKTERRISDLDGDPESEARANAFAADALIPPDQYAEFSASGRYTKASVCTFADDVGISPGIVVGRLQRDGLIPHNWMNDLKVQLSWPNQDRSEALPVERVDDPNAARVNPRVRPLVSAIDAACRRHHVTSCALFGSATQVEAGVIPTDLDVLVTFGPLEPRMKAREYAALAAELEEIMGVPVDVMVSTAVRNPYLAEEIERTKVVLYEVA